MAEQYPLSLSEQVTARQTARRREHSVQLAAVVIALMAFVGAGLLVSPINRIRKERQLVIDPDTIKGLPPGLALLGKLGTFRALVIDWASIRAERLKEEGKVYEALQLHETVCALAPRFPNVWVYAAWNMAYNISVSQYSPEARWQWVQNGLRLLRDKGIPLNPKSVTLYKELSWIYWHKIGDFLDDEHLNYKRALATDMESVLGPPPVTLTDQEYFDWFKKIVDAPRDFEAFLARDAEAAALVARLDAVSLKPDKSLLDFVAAHLRPELQVSQLVLEAVEEDPLLARQLELTSDPRHKEAFERLLAAVRSKVLRDQYRLDPAVMFQLMERYGPLDWRNAYAHALYWADMGDRVSRGHQNINIFDQRNNARFVLFSLQNLILKGRITLWPDFDDPFSSYFDLTPDTRYIPYLYKEYMRLGKELFGDDPRFVEGTPGPVYLTGFITNMRHWIQLLYLEGGEKNLELSKTLYAWLRHHARNPDGTKQAQYVQTLEDFVMGDVLSQLDTYRAAGAFVRSLIQRALKEFSLGSTRSAFSSLRRARLCYDFWMTDTKGDINERRMMQPLEIILRDEIEAYVKHPRIASLYKAMLWKHLPLRQRQMTYDRLVPFFERLCAERPSPWSVAKAFPQPPGMEAFRQEEIKTRGAARREGLEQGKRHGG